MEVNLPIEKTWDIIMDPNTILLFSEEGLSDEIEYLQSDNELHTGSCMTVKYKQIKDPIVYNFTNVDPFKKCDITAKGFLFTLENSTSFEEVAPDKTRLYNKVTVKSFLIHFVDLSTLSNKIDLKYFQLNNYLNDLSEKEEIVYQPYSE